MFAKGELLFGAHLARQPAANAGTIVVVEGYVDALALHEVGITNAVTVMGTAISEHQIAALRKSAERIVLMLDGDAPRSRRNTSRSVDREQHGRPCRYRWPFRRL